MISQKTSNDLFNKIRSKFGNITIGDSAGSATADPKQAVFFDFEFTEAEDKFGRISISLARRVYESVLQQRSCGQN
jgi:hypothetical protein